MRMASVIVALIVVLPTVNFDVAWSKVKFWLAPSAPDRLYWISVLAPSGVAPATTSAQVPLACRK